MRIKWIDGLKAFACLAVLWHHFTLAFYPGQYDGTMSCDWFDFSQNPLSFVINGNFMVALFMVISGVVASYYVLNKDKINYFKLFYKRYFRLMLPTIPVALVVVLFYKMNLFCNVKTSLFSNSGYLASWYRTPIGIVEAIKCVVFSCWISTDTSISGIFWVFPYFLWGFVLSAMLCMLLKIKPRLGLIVVLLSTLILFFVNCYFCAFTLGTLIAYLQHRYQYSKKSSKGMKVVAMICIVAGLILGGYPSKVSPTNAYAYLPDLSGFNILNYSFWHIIGAFLLVFGMFNVIFMQRIFEGKLFVFLGSISYEIFLIHMLVLTTVSCSTFDLIFTSTQRYHVSSLFTFLITNILTVIVAYLYHKLLVLMKINKK